MGICNYRDEDASAVASFFAATHALDPTVEAITEERWREFTRLSFNHGARDFAVVGGDGGLIAVLMSTQHPSGVRHFRIFVHPAHRREGIATALLRHVEAQDEKATLQCSCMKSWPAGLAMIEKEGFEPHHRLLMMDLVDEVPAPGTPPAGFTLRPYREGGDDEAWIRLHEDGFADLDAFHPLTRADVTARRSGAGFHVWIAEQAGDAVGFVQTEDYYGDRGHVASLVVDRRFRGRGLGRALMLRGIATLRAGGPRTVVLSVYADNEAAIRLYESLGFATTDENQTWRKPRV
jgi:mycothiol synthase